MGKCKFIYFLCLLALAMIVPTASATTYRLVRATSVVAGQKYVFEQAGYVMTNTISNNALQTKSTYQTYELTGNESYVWEYKLDNGKYFLRNCGLNSKEYLTATKGNTGLSFDSKSNSVSWIFIAQGDGTFMIKLSSAEQYLACQSVSSHQYRAYEKKALPESPHFINVYKLVEEDAAKAVTSLKFSYAQKKVMKSENFSKPTLTATGFEGNITYSSSNTNVATVNGATGDVTLVGAGFTQITASYEGSNTNNPAEATYTLFVTDGNGTAGKPYTVGDFLSGHMEANAKVYVVGYVVGSFSDSGAFVVKNHIDKDVAIADSRDGANWDNAIPVSLDSYKATYNLKNNPEVLNRRIVVYGMVKYYIAKTGIQTTTSISPATNYPVTITSAQYATYRTSEALDFSGTDVAAYTAAVSDSHVVLTKISDGIVPAGKGVVLYSDAAGTYDIPVTANEASTSDTGLLISDGATATKENTIYVLGKKNGTVGFYRWVGSTSLSSGKVYLRPNESDASREFLTFLFDDDNDPISTSVDDVRSKKEEVKGYFFDLQGRKVIQPAKGLYIVNGKKVLVK